MHCPKGYGLIELQGNRYGVGVSPRRHVLQSRDTAIDWYAATDDAKGIGTGERLGEFLGPV